MKLSFFINSKLQRLKFPLITISTFYALVATSIAQADFHKAILAYQNRDGLSLLNEVKDAVNKKNNDGLMLFMNVMSIDRGTSMKTSLYKVTQDNKQTTLKNILTDQQRQELIELLISATNYSNADAQFYLAPAIRELNNPQLTASIKSNDDYAKSGSLVAAHYSKLTDIEKAELGDPFAQMLLGLSYLRSVDYRKYGCDESPDKLICHPRDEPKGDYWLKKSLKNYESKGHGEMGAYFNSMCDLLQNQDDPKQLKQAYLWCQMGINSGAQGDSWRLLDKMHTSGKLKITAPEVDAVWNTASWEDKRRMIKALSMVEKKELPDWVIWVRKELNKSKLPIFTYYVNDYMEYELDIYADGRANIIFGTVANGYPGPDQMGLSYVDTKKDTLLKIPPSKVKAFLTELKKIGFYEWTPVNNDIGFCDNFDASRCIPKRYQATVRNGEKIQRFYYAGFAGSVDYKNESTKRLGLVSTLVEKYFPTRILRCEMGVSEEYKQACIKRDDITADIAKADLTKPNK